MAMAIAKVNGDHSGPRVVGTRTQFEMKITFSGTENYATGGKTFTDAASNAISDMFGVSYIATMIPMRVVVSGGSATEGYAFDWIADGQKFQIHTDDNGTEFGVAALDAFQITVRCESADA
jgi:hypothetical protein